MAPGVHKYCIVGYCLLIISSFLDFQMVTSSTKQFLLKIELSIVELHSSEYFIVELHSSEYSFQWEAQTFISMGSANFVAYTRKEKYYRNVLWSLFPIFLING